MREGLRLLEERDLLHEARLNQMRQEIQIGVGQMAHDEYTECIGKSLKQPLHSIKKEGRATLNKKC